MAARLLSALTVSLLIACGGGGSLDGGGDDAGFVPTAPHASMSWQMRCTEGTCPPADPPARTIDHDNGQDGFEVVCDLFPEGTGRRMDLTARSPEGYGFEVRGAQIGLEGGQLMGSLCQMRVFEPDDVNVLGMCGRSLPSDGTPCQIQRIDLRDVGGVMTLFGEVLCERVTEEGDPSDLRNMTSATMTNGYASFEFTGCVGI